MAGQMTAQTARFTLGPPLGWEPPELSEQHKLDRLRELRAVIEALRCEERPTHERRTGRLPATAP